MRVASAGFKRAARRALASPTLQAALARLETRFVDAHALAVAELDNFERYREAAAQIREEAIRHLPVYLRHFEQQAQAAGAVVHWAHTAKDVNDIVAHIARTNGVRTIVKSKSMVTEECALNAALEEEGLTVVETDLGEYILQLAEEPPSHIVAPVVHKSQEEVATLFETAHRRPRLDDIAALCREAREILRPQFLGAEMGITGANFIIAETGSVVLFTNEGNGRLVTTLPRIHVAITGIEKVVPTLDDLATLMRVLPRSATGQAITNYVSLLTGVRGGADLDGPEQCHIILLDNGRSAMLGTPFEPMLRCIRCGACLNHCPVYQQVGGHAYGWVYPGPMGSVLTPLLADMLAAKTLPQASTFCGACADVCPVKIPLPDLLRALRQEQYRTRTCSRGQRFWSWLWTALAARPRLYAVSAWVTVRLLRLLGGSARRLRWLPLGRGWFHGRDLPAPTGRTFRELYRKRAQ